MTIFLALSIVLVITVGFSIILVTKSQSNLYDAQLSQTDVQNSMSALQLAAQLCLQEHTVGAMQAHGVSPDAQTIKNIEGYIDHWMPLCVNLGPFQDMGYALEPVDASTVVDLSGDVLIATLDFPLTLSLGAVSSTLEELSYVLPITTSIPLPVDATGRATETFTVLSSDRRVEVQVPVGTRITRAGSPVSAGDELGITIEDKTADGMQNRVVVADVIYDLEDGLRFDPPIPVVFHYTDEGIGFFEEEDRLTVSTFDESIGLWVTLPVESRDTRENTITLRTGHFSAYAITSSVCNSDTIEEVTINPGVIFQSSCQDCRSDFSITGFTYEGESRPTIYFKDAGVVATDTPGDHYGEGCIGPYDFDYDDPDDDGIKYSREYTGYIRSECISRLGGRFTADPGSAYCDMGGQPQYGVGGNECDFLGGTYHPAPTTGTCTVDVPATPKTYGYLGLQDVGGKANYQFKIRDSGNGCIAKEVLDDPLDFEVKKEDPFDNLINVLVNGAPYEEGYELYSGSSPLRSGVNVVHAEVVNKDNNLCSKLWIDSLTLRGQNLFLADEVEAGNYACPVGDEFRITGDWGDPRTGRQHYGIDITYYDESGGAVAGDPVYAIMSGTVDRLTSPSKAACGHGIAILQDDGMETLYCHFPSPSPFKVGERVNQNDVVGFVGDSGNPAHGAHHLHIQMKAPNGRAVDIESCICQNLDGWDPSHVPESVRGCSAPGTIHTNEATTASAALLACRDSGGTWSDGRCLLEVGHTSPPLDPSGPAVPPIEPVVPPTEPVVPPSEPAVPPVTEPVIPPPAPTPPPSSSSCTYYPASTIDETFFPCPVPVRYADTPISYADAFGWIGSRCHDGIDLLAPHRTPVRAIADGLLNFTSNIDCGCGAWIEHADGFHSRYCHLEETAGFEPFIDRKNRWISCRNDTNFQIFAGALIGYVGRTGNQNADHLHFAMAYGDRSNRIDPDAHVCWNIEGSRFSEYGDQVEEFEVYGSVT